MVSSESPQAKSDKQEITDILGKQEKDSVMDLRRYDWIKYSLLNRDDIEISNNLKNVLEQDMFKDYNEELCSDQPQFDYEGELPFTDLENLQIRNIIEDLYKSGVSNEDIVKSAVEQISGVDGLNDTWQILSEKFNGSRKYFFLAREYLKNISEDVFANMDMDNSMEL